MASKIFLLFSIWLEAVFYLSTVSVPVFPFQVDAGTILYRVDSDVHLQLMRIGRWSEHRFVFVCQLVEVIREADAIETSGELGLALLDYLVGESQLRIPNLEPDAMLSIMLPL